MQHGALLTFQQFMIWSTPVFVGQNKVPILIITESAVDYSFSSSPMQWLSVAPPKENLSVLTKVVVLRFSRSRGLQGNTTNTAKNKDINIQSSPGCTDQGGKEEVWFRKCIQNLNAQQHAIFQQHHVQAQAEFEKTMPPEKKEKVKMQHAKGQKKWREAMTSENKLKHTQAEAKWMSYETP